MSSLSSQLRIERVPGGVRDRAVVRRLVHRTQRGPFQGGPRDRIEVAGGRPPRAASSAGVTPCGLRRSRCAAPTRSARRIGRRCAGSPARAAGPGGARRAARRRRRASGGTAPGSARPRVVKMCIGSSVPPGDCSSTRISRSSHSPAASGGEAGRSGCRDSPVRSSPHRRHAGPAGSRSPRHATVQRSGRNPMGGGPAPGSRRIGASGRHTSSRMPYVDGLGRAEEPAPLQVLLDRCPPACPRRRPPARRSGAAPPARSSAHWAMLRTWASIEVVGSRQREAGARQGGTVRCTRPPPRRHRPPPAPGTAPAPARPSARSHP